MRAPFDNTYARLPEAFFRPIQLEGGSTPRLIRWNHALAERLGIGADPWDPKIIAAKFSGSEPIEGATPIAMAYAGHQFGGFSPQLGDGRAALLGEIPASDGRRYDIHLKGSGRTPFSRRGDGKSALGPTLREYIVSEAMTALGVPSTRALAVVSTGDTVYRETPVAGGIFTRVARSHIRIGTFEYFAAREETEHLRTLTHYTVQRLYPERQEEPNLALALLNAALERQSELIAQWMRVGFIHGVMNTDNMNLSGETIDFGPCAFLDEYNPAKTFSSIDHQGRYAYHAQGQIGLWNLTRFAEALLPLIAPTTDGAIERAKDALERYPQLHSEALRRALLAKIGVDHVDSDSISLIEGLLERLEAEAVDFTLFFRRLTQSLETHDDTETLGLFRDQAPVQAWLQRWRDHLESASINDAIQRMQAANPIRIPRNHRIEEVIEAAEGDNFTPFHRMVDALEAPYQEAPEFADYETPPRPEERVQATFCGT